LADAHLSQTNAVLLELAGRLAAGYVAQTSPRAVLLVGSTAAGFADAYSDIDLIAYYDDLPSQEQLDSARLLIKATSYSRPGASVEIMS